MGYPGFNVVTGPISLSAESDVYATHLAALGKGGHASVDTIADRNAITLERREFGMTRRVTGDPNPANNKTYVLKNTAMGGVDDNPMNNANWMEEATNGTVTSVGVALPASIFDVTSSPVTSSGVITATLKTQAANYVLAGPVSGVNDVPVFRPLVAADIPTLAYVALSGGVMTGLLTLSGDPINSLHAVTKNYVDALVTGLSWKSPAADCATTGNIVLSGEQTIDGFLTSASRVLVKDQIDKTKNGIWRSGSGAWTREPDADDGVELRSATILIQNGTANANSQWTCITKNIDLDTTDIVFTKISSTATYSNGAGLSLSSGVFSIATGGVSNAMLRDSAALSVIGRSANSTGVPADIVGASGVLRISASVLGFGTIASADIANSAVTYAKIQNVSATARLLGRYSTGAGVVQEISLGSGLSLDSGTGVLSSTGGGGTLTGSGTASRIAIWTGAAALGDDSTLTYDGANDILKAGRVNVSVSGDPGAGVTDGDFVYNSTALDFRARINGNWVNLTRQETATQTGTTYSLVESDRNKIIYFTNSSPITVTATNLSTGFTATVVKAGVGNVTIAVSGGLTFSGADTVISTSWGYATLLKRTTTEWAGFGALGTAGGGTFVLTNGSGTTASGNGVNLGGALTSNVEITTNGGRTVYIGETTGGASTYSAFLYASANLKLSAGRTESVGNTEGIAFNVESTNAENKISITRSVGGAPANNFKGIVYAVDWSSNFVDGSLISKLYADSTLRGKALAAPVLANNGQSIRWNNTSQSWEYFSTSSIVNGNGTTVNGSAIDLGGTLNATTTIVQGSNDLLLGTSAGTGSIVLTSGGAWCSINNVGGVGNAEIRGSAANSFKINGQEAAGTQLSRLVSTGGALNQTLHLYRGTGSATATVGGGLSIVMSPIGSNTVGSGVLSYILTNVTSGSETGKFRFNTKVSGVDSNAAEIAFTGSWFNAGVAIGTTSALSSNVILQLTSTTQALLLTRITNESNISTPLNGMMYYNSTTNKFRAYEGGIWKDMGGGVGNSGAANEIVKSDGSNVVGTGVFTTVSGDLKLGSSALSVSTHSISVESGFTSASLELIAQGASGNVKLSMGSAGSLLIGGDSTAGSGRFIRANGSANDINVEVYAKGTGVVLFGNNTGDYIAVDPILKRIYTQKATAGTDVAMEIVSAGGSATGNNGDAIKLTGGAAYSTAGNGNGGSVIITSGIRRVAGTGVDGNIQLNSNGGNVVFTQALANDNALTQVLVRDPATGIIKYRDVSSIGGGGGGSTIVTNRQTASYVFVLSDAGKLVEMNVAGANTLTVPPNSSVAFPIGTMIMVAQYGAGQTTFTPGSGVTLRSADGYLKSRVRYSQMTAIKIGTDEWYINGDLAA